MDGWRIGCFQGFDTMHLSCTVEVAFADRCITDGWGAEKMTVFEFRG